MVINWVQGYWSSRSFQSYLNYPYQATQCHQLED